MSWSDLSTKLKQNVVGRLDLMSRHALRSTCRLNRYLVNDMDYFVPRVRVSVKDSGILIMIHTGIDKFLRIEIGGGPDGKTVIRKFQNSYNAKDVIQKVLPSTPRFHAAQILCGLLSHDKSLIGTMEWEIEGGINVKHLEEETKSVEASLAKEVHFLSVLQKYSGKSTGIFRATKLATSWNMTPEMENFLQKILVPADLKSIERINVTPSEKSMTPLFCMDTYLPLSDRGVPCGTKTIGHEYIKMIYDGFVYMSMLSPGFGHFRFAKYDDYAKNIWVNVKFPVKKINQELYMKEEPANSFMGELTLLHMRSPCGYWIYAVLNSRLDIFNAYRVYNKNCGLGWLCKKCTDPFEYDYYQNLGRRVLWEPEYNDVISCGFEESRHQWSPRIEGARVKYERNVKKQKKKPVIQKMWGFGNGVEKSSDSEEEKNESCPISEDEDSGESTDSEDSEKTLDSENEESEVSEDADEDSEAIVNSEESTDSEDEQNSEESEIEESKVVQKALEIEKEASEDSGAEENDAKADVVVQETGQKDSEADQNHVKKSSEESNHGSTDSDDEQSSEDSENEESEVVQKAFETEKEASEDSGAEEKDEKTDVVIQEICQKELVIEKEIPEESDSEADDDDAKKDSGESNHGSTDSEDEQSNEDSENEESEVVKIEKEASEDSGADKNDAKKGSEDVEMKNVASEDMEPDGFTKFMMMSRALSEERFDRAFLKWAVFITGFAFFTSVLYVVFLQVI